LAPLLLASSINYIVDRILVRWIDEFADAAYIYLPTAMAGAVTGDSLPSLCCVTAQFHTGTRGASASRGSVHLAAPAESNTLLDQLSAGGMTLYNTWASAQQTAFVSGDSNTYAPIVISSKYSQLKIPRPLPAGASGPPAPPINVVFTPISSVTINKNVGRMKHRQNPSN
jgi:hypothetical protein